MESLPVETVQRIVHFTCTDGGATGCALSLVSRDFRAIARTTRFHSVALAASPRRLQAFVDLYERECDPVLGVKPLIRHLHLTFPHTPDSASIRRRRKMSSKPNLRTRSLSPSRPSPSHSISVIADSDRPPVESSTSGVLYPTKSPEYRHAAETLFRLVTSDLITLVVQCGFTAGSSIDLRAIQSPFPSLREATFVGIYDVETLFSTQLIHKRIGVPIFPALTHLSLGPTGSLDRHSCHGIDLFWSYAAPRVTHLSVSEAENYAEALVRAVGVGMREDLEHQLALLTGNGPPWNDPISRLHAPRVPSYPSVRQLLVQPSAVPASTASPPAHWRYEVRVTRLRYLREGCEDIGVEVVMLPAPKDSQNLFDHYALVRSGWLARVQDDSDDVGCWGQFSTLSDGRG
ncbi:hypothetical protein C2E23DRAFT_849902 [Lenzites betulinus]|nr:hypothetical protein C2E23DRAFT_849902 [Lenzites betulinus]